MNYGKRNQRGKKKTTAYHEAGHVVMYLLTGIEITGVNIIEDSKNFGFTGMANYGFLPFNDKEMREDEIKCTLAGGVAEAYYCYRKCIKYDSEGTTSDHEYINRLFYEGHHRYRTFEGFEKRVGQLKRETERQIRAHWSFIETLASTLLSKEHLTADGINKLWKTFHLTELQ